MSAQALAVGLCALATLCAPARGHRAVARFDAVLASGRPAPSRGTGWAALVGRAGRVRCVLAAAAVVSGVLLGVVGVLPALSGGVVAALLVQLAWAARAGRMRAAQSVASLEWVAAVAAELRAGRAPEQALAASTEHAAPVLKAALLSATRTAAYGGDVPRALREVALALGGPAQATDGQGPCADALLRVAAGWSLSQSSGCSLAAVLDAVETDLRSRQRHRREIDGLLAGPRATAALLAVLPVLGLVLGSSLGARPWHVLTSTGPGQLALVAGVTLDAVGVLWTARLVRGTDQP